MLNQSDWPSQSLFFRWTGPSGEYQTIPTWLPCTTPWTSATSRTPGPGSTPFSCLRPLPAALHHDGHGEWLALTGHVLGRHELLGRPVTGAEPSVDNSHKRPWCTDSLTPDSQTDDVLVPPTRFYWENTVYFIIRRPPSQHTMYLPPGRCSLLEQKTYY